MKRIRFVGLDVHKGTTAVAVAESGWGEPLDLGTIPTTAEAMAKLVRKLGGKGSLLVDGRGKPRNKTVAAVARELLGFIWAIAREVRAQQLSQAAD